MPKTILITGSTDGIGLEAAKKLVSLGHHVLIHGRNDSKLERARETLSALPGDGQVETYLANLSHVIEVQALAKAVAKKHAKLDVLINNAGVYKTHNPITQNGLDVRFAVNTIAPYLLTQQLLPLLDSSGRVINVSSAAQSPVDLKALTGQEHLSDGPAYAQSKLALTMWSFHLAHSLKGRGPIIVAVNPGSMLGSKMVKDAFGVDGGDIQIGADILARAALTDEFAGASGQYFDNDSRQFADPHTDALDPRKSAEIARTIDAILTKTEVHS